MSQYNEEGNHWDIIITNDTNNLPEVIKTFYYTLTDSNGGRTHRADASVATYEYDLKNQIDNIIVDQAIQLVNDNNIDQATYNTVVASVITGIGSFFNNFKYHEISSIPLSNSNWESLPGSIIVDGVRVEASDEDNYQLYIRKMVILLFLTDQFM